MDPTFLSSLLGLAALVLSAAVLYYAHIHKRHPRTALHEYVMDLTEMARKGELDPVIGRDEEIEHMIRILSRRTKNNPILIGEPGVGKTAIVEELANRIVHNAVPISLQGKRVLSLDLSGLIAGTKYRGEFEERLNRIVQEIVAAERNIIVFIDEVHTLAEAGEAEGAISASNILKPALARGDLQAIGATTTKEFEEVLMHDPTLERRFQSVIIQEPDVETTRNILRGVRKKYEEHHRLHISDAAIDEAVELANAYIQDRHFPDKAIDLMDEAAAMVRLWAINHPDIAEGKELTVTPENIREVVGTWVQEHTHDPRVAAQKLSSKEIARREREGGNPANLET